MDNQIEDVKTLNDKCLNSFKNVVYELEKITDILIRLLEQKDSSSPFLRFLRKYKSRIEEAKGYVIKELNTEEFNIDVRNGYVKVMQLLKDFSKNIIQVAQKNNLEVIAKVATKLPAMTVELCNNFIKLMKTNSVLLKNEVSKVNTQQNNQNPQSVNENIDYHSILLNEDETVIGNLMSGFGNVFSNIWNLFSSNTSAGTNIFSKLTTKITEQFDQIQTDYNNTIGNVSKETGIGKIGEFLSSQGVMGLLGNLIAITVIWWGIRKLWKTIKWKVFNRR